jgi:hypothetical protein
LSCFLHHVAVVLIVGGGGNCTPHPHFKFLIQGYCTALHRQQTMDAFLRFNEYDILQDAGKVSHEVAKALAEKAYEQYRIQQDENYESDFDKEIKRLKDKT